MRCLNSVHIWVLLALTAVLPLSYCFKYELETDDSVVIEAEESKTVDIFQPQKEEPSSRKSRLILLLLLQEWLYLLNRYNNNLQQQFINTNRPMFPYTFKPNNYYPVINPIFSPGMQHIFAPTIKPVSSSGIPPTSVSIPESTSQIAETIRIPSIPSFTSSQSPPIPERTSSPGTESIYSPTTPESTSSTTTETTSTTTATESASTSTTESASTSTTESASTSTTESASTSTTESASTSTTESASISTTEYTSTTFSPTPEQASSTTAGSVSVPNINVVHPSASVECQTIKGKAGKCSTFQACIPMEHMQENDRDNMGSDLTALAEEMYTAMKTETCASRLNTVGDVERMVCCPISNQESNSTSTNPSSVQSPGIDELNKIKSPECGIVKAFLPGKESKITGGKEAQKGEFPWMVAIFGRNGKHTCGGSLINNEFVLTASHCLATYRANDVAHLTVTIGDHNIKTFEDGPHEVRKISKIILHKGFDLTTYRNDIALMKLDRPVEFNNYIQPICLPTNNNNTQQLEGRQVVVSGWGRVRSYGRPADILRKVEFPVWSQYECNRVYNTFAPGRLLDSNICAGDGRRNKDACIGDSGGPLMIKYGSIWHQVGIVSWGKGCGSFPGVYNRVDKYLPWILKNIQL